MSVTLVAGQLVEHLGTNGRLWELISPATEGLDGPQWNVRLHTSGTHGARPVGTETIVSVHWMVRNCQDWVPPVIPPPQGDGPQTARIIDENGELVSQAIFDTAEETINWLDENLYPEQIGQWFGWNMEFAGFVDSKPDMTVRSVDGALVWADA